MAREIAQGMNWLHKQNVLHLDLKPANLLCMHDWTIKIADFGLSRLQPKNPDEVTNVSGTPLYMPPEVFCSKPQMSDKCDVFAYGILLWELVTEQYPYDRKYTNIVTLQKAVRDQKERPLITDQIPKTMSSLMIRCWDHDPSVRPNFGNILDEKINDTDLFDAGLSEAVAGSALKDLDGQVSKMWAKLSKESKTTEGALPWGIFSRDFSALMKMPEDHINMRALKALLNVDENHDKVTWIYFNHFIKTFGPLEPAGGVKSSTLDEVTNLIKEKWFWGYMSGDDAARVLQGYKAGSYLIRFSEKLVGVFTLSYRHYKDNKVIHKRLDKCAWQQLAVEVKKEKKNSKLSRPALERPVKFDVLFSKMEKKITTEL